MENKATDMIVNVKINKQLSWKPTFVRSGYDYLRNATIIVKRT